MVGATVGEVLAAILPVIGVSGCKKCIFDGQYGSSNRAHEIQLNTK
jgi:hypothetical protein